MLKWWVIFIFFPALLFSQQFKINAQFELDSPRVKILYTTIDEVTKYFGKPDTVLKEYDGHLVKYKNGLSFKYIHTDQNRLIRAFFISPPAQAKDAYGIELNKTTVKEVWEKFPASHSSTFLDKGIVHVRRINYIFKPNWKIKNGIDPEAKIIGFDKWEIEDDYLTGGIGHHKYLHDNTADKNSERFLDSVVRLPGITYKKLSNVFKVTEKNDSYDKIEFREFDESKNEFGLEEKFGDMADNFYVAKNGNKIVFIVLDDREVRRVFVKDSSEYLAFAKKYEDKNGIKFDPYNKLVVTEQFCDFRYSNPRDEYFDHPPGRAYDSNDYDEDTPRGRDSLYNIFATELRSLSTSMQVYGVRGLYYLQRQGKKIREADKQLILSLMNSGKILKISYARGCFGHSAEAPVKEFIDLMEKGKELPKKWEDHGKF